MAVDRQHLQCQRPQADAGHRRVRRRQGRRGEPDRTLAVEWAPKVRVNAVGGRHGRDRTVRTVLRRRRVDGRDLAPPSHSAGWPSLPKSVGPQHFWPPMRRPTSAARRWPCTAVASRRHYLAAIERQQVAKRSNSYGTGRRPGGHRDGSGPRHRASACAGLRRRRRPCGGQRHRRRPGRHGGRREQPGAAVVEEIKAAGGEAVVNGDDVADWAGAQNLIQTAVDTFGGLDVLVNNAGFVRDRMLANTSEEEWDAVVRVHLKGHFAPLRHAAAYWRGLAKEGKSPSTPASSTPARAPACRAASGRATTRPPRPASRR